MPELVVIAGVAALIFGPKKLPEVGNPIFVQLFFSDPNSAATDGILATNALAHLESSLRRKFGDPKAAISDFFDVISGSDAGGILAALIFTWGLKDGSTRPMFTTKDAPLSSSSSASQVLYTRLPIADMYGEETLYKEFYLNIDDQEQSLNITFTPTRVANPEGSVKMSVCSPVWLKSSSKAAMVTTTCFLSVIVLGCNKQSSSFKSSNFESFIYRALTSKLHLQSFTYKASV
ncbi:hypothetical protein ACFX15_044926 [Malus domestica]